MGEAFLCTSRAGVQADKIKGVPRKKAARPQQKSTSPAVILAIALALALVGAWLVTPRRSPQPDSPSATAPVQDQAETPAPIAQAPLPDASWDLPPLPVADYPTNHPPDIVRAVHKFAADHPEVLQYVPCFCGCEGQGHRANDDCFIKERDTAGRVSKWEPHGIS
ncbi:MAG: hypothetical protein HYX76_09630 [Acidobacteria bacterium]|nr:hypothetical protein [Acidobacteriota bacterium]